MRAVCLGAHILDVLGRPVTDIPAGQGRRVLEEIRLTAAGTAAGTAVDLAKLGAEVSSIGAIGDDTAGRVLRTLLADHHVDAAHLAVRPGGATPATILPIRPNGERPALHAPGSMAELSGDDIDLDLIARADFLHVGGPDVLGDFATRDLPAILRHAREHDTVVSMDLLSAGRPGLVDELGTLWEHVDWFLPNDDQLRALTGHRDLEAAGARMRDAGVGAVVVTCGAAGALLITESVTSIPAFVVDVVDTTGCGDAFCAGLLVGLDRGLPARDAATLGTAAAALVAQGLGSDAGIVDLDTTLAYLAELQARGAPMSH